MSYQQITAAERYTLTLLRRQGLCAAAIARILGRHRSTVGREVRRNTTRHDGWYRAERAHSLCHRPTGPLPAEPALWAGGLAAGPGAPGRGMEPRTDRGPVRRGRDARHQPRNHLSPHRDGSPANGRSPTGRRARRTRLGHLEGDTVLGSRDHHCILTLVDRTSGSTMIGKLAARTVAASTRRAVMLIRTARRRVRTITVDNGTEFHGYRTIEDQTAARFYFATPHHAWERGTNENTNGLIRQYLPKGHSMRALTQPDCHAIARRLNRRPRKRLGYRTPEECYGC